MKRNIFNQTKSRDKHVQSNIRQQAENEFYQNVITNLELWNHKEWGRLNSKGYADEMWSRFLILKNELVQSTWQTSDDRLSFL
jgi:hypothetical protein